MKNMTRQERNKKKRKDISKEVNKTKTKKLIKVLFKLIILLGIITFSLFILNKYIFTKKIIVHEELISNNNIPDSFKGSKIIHFSDINYGSTIFMDDIKNIVNLINIRKPDLVLFTGNLIDKDYKISVKELENLTTELSKIKSNLGKYYVASTNDKDNYLTILNQSNFKLLNNDYDLIYKNKECILLTGLSKINNNYDIEKTFSYYNDPNNNKNIYTISMYPDDKLFDTINSKYNSNLNLCSNSNNYFINIPFIKKEYRTKEHYNIDNKDLFISRGIGTNKYKIRLFTMPTIYFYRLDN